MKYIYINIAFAQFQRFVYGVRPNHLYANHLFLHFLADAWFNPDRLNPKGKRCVSVCVCIFLTLVVFVDLCIVN